MNSGFLLDLHLNFLSKAPVFEIILSLLRFSKLNVVAELSPVNFGVRNCRILAVTKLYTVPVFQFHSPRYVSHRK